MFECAKQGDKVALNIANTCAEELFMHIKSCIACADYPKICVATGGMFKADMLCDMLNAKTADLGIRMEYPTVAPVAGAVTAAAGADATPEFITKLKDGLNGLR